MKYSQKRLIPFLYITVDEAEEFLVTHFRSDLKWPWKSLLALKLRQSRTISPREYVVAKAKSVLLRCVRTYAVCDLPWSRQQCRLEKGIKQQSVHTIQCLHCNWIFPSKKKKMTTKYLLVLVCLVVYLFNKPNQNVAEAMPMKFMCDMCESNWIHCLMKCHM